MKSEKNHREEILDINRDDHLDSVVGLIPGHVYWKDINGNYLGCNNAQAKSLGLKSRYDIVNRRPYEKLGEKEAKRLKEIDKEVIKQKKTITEEEPGIRENGEVGIFLTKKSPLLNKNNKVIGILGISIDITDKKKLEQEKVEKANLENQLLASELVGASIAHELRTPLMTILNYLKVIEVKVKDSPELISDSINIIKNEVNKSNKLINIMLMNIQKHENPEMSVIDINECIIEAINRFPYSRDKDKNLIRYNQSESFQFMGNSDLMVHVLFNLIKNALYSIYKAEKGYIQITLSKSNDFNIIRFKDTGTGISETDKDKIFNKFFTTSKIGSGVGLSFCKFSIELFGGKIDCNSTYGEYTQFNIYLPKLQEE